MSRLKASVSGLLALSLAVAPLSGQAKGASRDMCYTAKEWPAFNVQVMMGTLMDAYYQCQNVVGHNHATDYNGLVARTSAGMPAVGSELRAHFKRVYGGRWEDRLDGFVTRAANYASSDSMASMTFCRDSDVLFQDVQLANAQNLGVVAIAFNETHFPDLSQLGTLCPAKRARVQLASHRSHHHHARKVASSN